MAPLINECCCGASETVEEIVEIVTSQSEMWRQWLVGVPATSVLYVCNEPQPTMNVRARERIEEAALRARESQACCGPARARRSVWESLVGESSGHKPRTVQAGCCHKVCSVEQSRERGQGIAAALPATGNTPAQVVSEKPKQACC